MNLPPELPGVSSFSYAAPLHRQLWQQMTEYQLGPAIQVKHSHSDFKHYKWTEFFIICTRQNIYTCGELYSVDIELDIATNTVMYAAKPRS